MSDDSSASVIGRMSKTAQFIVIFVGLYIAISFIREPLYNWISGLGLSDLEILILGLVLMIVCGWWAGEID